MPDRTIQSGTVKLFYVRATERRLIGRDRSLKDQLQVYSAVNRTSAGQPLAIKQYSHQKVSPAFLVNPIDHMPQNKHFNKLFYQIANFRFLYQQK
jgi:hypothetical protein